MVLATSTARPDLPSGATAGKCRRQRQSCQHSGCEKGGRGTCALHCSLITRQPGGLGHGTDWKPLWSPAPDLRKWPGWVFWWQVTVLVWLVSRLADRCARGNYGC